MVSTATETSLDIFVSPANILCGQDVPLTLEFIRTLGHSILMTEVVMNQAVNFVQEAGDNYFYKRGVRTRKGFVTFQAAYRGWLVRRECDFKLTQNGVFSRYEEAESNQQSKPVDEDSISSLENSVGRDEFNEANESPESSAKDTESSRPGGPVVISDVSESYNTLVSHKAAVEDEIKLAEEKLKTETERLKRILNINTAHTKSTTATSSGTLTHVTRPLSSPQIGTSTPAKKFDTSVITMDLSFSDKITNFSTIQLTLKKKERRLNEREIILKQKLATSKQREESLKLQEERVTDLANKIRKQQLNLNEQKLNFDRMKAMKPPSPPNSSSLPCTFCIEKERRLKELRGKMRERMDVLSQREAYVIEKAHELRRREIQLVERERVMTNAKGDIFKEAQQSTSRSNSHEFVHRTNRGVSGYESRDNGMYVKGSREIERQKENFKHVTSRRSGQIPDYDGCSNDQTDSASIRDSFVEKVPTIMEETQSACEDESDNGDEVLSYRNEELSNTSTSTDVKRDKSLDQKSIDLGTCSKSQSSRRVSRPSSALKSKKLQGKKSREPTPLSPAPAATFSKVSLQEKSPKKKHVYTFEKKGLQEKISSSDLDSFMREVGEKSENYLSTPDKPKREKKTKATYEKHDDWISSFDMQMKSAMNKLRDLS